MEMRESRKETRLLISQQNSTERQPPAWQTIKPTMTDQSTDEAVVQSSLPAGERKGSSRIFFPFGTLPDATQSRHASGTAIVNRGVHQLTHACLIAPEDEVHRLELVPSDT